MSNKTLIQIEFIVSVIINIPILFFQWFVLRQTHKDMMLMRLDEFRKGILLTSYLDFKKNFKLIDWKYNKCFPNSLFGNSYHSHYENYFHADIISINGQGYLLTPIGLMLANNLKRKKIREIKKHPSNKIRWAA
jgi:hypothetical protein